MNGGQGRSAEVPEQRKVDEIGVKVQHVELGGLPSDLFHFASGGNDRVPD